MNVNLLERDVVEIPNESRRQTKGERANCTGHYKRDFSCENSGVVFRLFKWNNKKQNKTKNRKK